jgi:hypothetical protein
MPDMQLPVSASLVLQPSAKPPYRDLGVMQELAVMMRSAQKAAARAPLVADESKKWLQWEEFLVLVQALRAECAGVRAQCKA